MCPRPAHAPDRTPADESPPEINVTPEMIEAGARALQRADDDLFYTASLDSLGQLAEEVYLAMAPLDPERQYKNK